MTKNKEKTVVSTSQINPVDYFNKNHAHDMFEMMLQVKNVRPSGIDSLTYVENHTDESKRMIVIQPDGHFVAEMDNGLKLPLNTPYSPFQMLQKFLFKNNFIAAMNHVMMKFMGIDNDYIRVGVDYCKVIQSRDGWDIKRKKIIAWNKTTIVDDLGKGAIYDINKYDSFIIEPNNKDYQPVVYGMYNMYADFVHKPTTDPNQTPKQFPWIEQLIRHIFGEQYEMGITYFKVLYDHPKQILPVLCLVSEENQTGKSTFGELLAILFGDNTVLANNHTLSSGFNSAYATKNIMVIEEALFEKKQDAEKIKSLATQKTINVNTKNVTEYTSPFYMKIVINSNNEDKFVNISESDIRYWVRKIPSLEGKGNHNILNDMLSEIPSFLAYLNSLEDVDLSKSRMVFTDDQLGTVALEKVKKESRSGLHKDILIYLDEHCQKNPEVDVFYFKETDIKDLFFKNDSRREVNYIKKVLENELKLKKETKRFNHIMQGQRRDYTVSIAQKQQSRVYTFPNPYQNN